MYAKDTGHGFDFSGTYDQVVENQTLNYTLDDGRQVQTAFTPTEQGVAIIQTFEAEDQNELDYQKEGWQAFLDNFKKHTETTYGK